MQIFFNNFHLTQDFLVDLKLKDDVIISARTAGLSSAAEDSRSL